MIKGAYPIAVNDVVEETIVNRSRFICYLFPCRSAEACKDKLKQIQNLHPQASHHCYAFVAKDPNNSQFYGFSDDGEPSGTAGRPMLNALQGSGVGQLCAIVVRYFGGTKLGTGGLQRAYGASVRKALTLIKTELKIPMVNKTLTCDYTQIDDVLHLITSCGGEVLEQSYQENIIFILALPVDQLTLIASKLQTLTSGQINLQPLND